MTPTPIRISRKEYSSEDVLNRLDDGQRVIVTVGKMGVSMDIVLRKSAGEYVCDTGIKLMTYNERNDMKRCIERLQLVE